MEDLPVSGAFWSVDCHHKGTAMLKTFTCHSVFIFTHRKWTFQNFWPWLNIIVNILSLVTHNYAASIHSIPNYGLTNKNVLTLTHCSLDVCQHWLILEIPSLAGKMKNKVISAIVHDPLIDYRDWNDRAETEIYLPCIYENFMVEVYTVSGGGGHFLFIVNVSTDV